ncbi:MAG: transposase zinc-binding domain-containing protein [Polyangiales bacterium]
MNRRFATRGELGRRLCRRGAPASLAEGTAPDCERDRAARRPPATGSRDKELRAFLRCGVLAHGFCRFRCGDCRFERLLPLSCTNRSTSSPSSPAAR